MKRTFLLAIAVCCMSIAAGLPSLPELPKQPTDGVVDRDVNVHTAVIHDFDLPDRHVLADRETAARAAVQSHPLLVALTQASFGIVTEYEYTPARDYVTLRTWNRQSIMGEDVQDAASGTVSGIVSAAPTTVSYDEGYIARFVVDPTDLTVLDAQLSPRAASVDTIVLTDREASARAVAASDPAVHAALAGRANYVRHVFARDDFAAPNTTCLPGTCSVVIFQVLNDVNAVFALVDHQNGVVVEVFATSDPPVSGNVTLGSYPPVEPVPHAQQILADHNPIVHARWRVYYSNPQTYGVQLDPYAGYRDAPANGQYVPVMYQTQIPFVKVWYNNCGSGPANPCFTDELRNDNFCGNNALCRGHQEVHYYNNGFLLHADYYAYCSPASWTANSWGCHKYTQEYYFWTTGSQGVFEPWLRIYGPGFSNWWGTSHYYTPWRFDNDLAGAPNDRVEAWSPSWVLVNPEANSPAVGPYGNCATSGIKWLVRDVNLGRLLCVMPYAPDTAEFWVLAYQPVNKLLPSAMDNNQNTNNVDVMEYYGAYSHGCQPNTWCWPGPWLYPQW